VRLAKRDVVPTEVNLRPEYRTFGELEGACRAFCDEANARPHRVTGRAPAEMLVDEHARLHRLPDEPYASAFGLTRRVVWDSTISMDGLRYSVPHQLIDARVWARWSGDTLIVTAIDEHGPREVARHQRASRDNPAAGISDEHYPDRDTDPLDREPSPRSADVPTGGRATAWQQHDELPQAGWPGSASRARPLLATR
jgi:hypothetical protein